MTEFQSLIVGAISGALMKHSGQEGPFLIDIEVQADAEGNYTNEIIVTGRVSGEQLLVTVVPRYDTPESVAEKMQGARLALDAAERHLT